MSAERPILIVPGLFNSPAGHWQSVWEQALPNATRVEQDNWDQPTLGEWTAGLVAALRAAPDAVLVGHSLGCALIAHVAQIRGARGIAGALLVAPAEVDREGPVGRLLEPFGPMPLDPLPFPTTVVASRTDPHVSFPEAARYALAWGSRFVDLGDAGHINLESGHGPWPEGRAIFDELMGRIDGGRG
jgi:predicted alpha/beta hydrolase family esterase